MTYEFEKDGPAEHSRHDPYERRHQSKFTIAMRSQGAIARALYEIGVKNPYDMYVAYDGIWMPLEWKAVRLSRKTYSLGTWRKKQPHQWEGLEKAFRCGFKPLFGIFWEQKKGDPYWMLIRAENLPRGDFIDPRDMKRVTDLEGLMNV